MTKKEENDVFKIPKSEPPKTFESFLALNIEYYVGLADIDLKKAKSGDKTLQELLGDVPTKAQKDAKSFYSQYKSHYDDIAKEDYSRLLQLNQKSIERGF